MKGKLKLTILEAKLFREHKMFGAKDPFIALEYNHDRFYTAVCKNGSKHPIFSDEEFEIDVKDTEDNITFKIMTIILITECQLIAAKTVKLSEFTNSGYIDDWCTLNYEDKDAGAVHFVSRWLPTIDHLNAKYLDQVKEMQMPSQNEV